MTLPTPELHTARLRLRPFTDADAAPLHVASARVLEKLGFVREGTLREDCVVNGDVSDSWVFGLLRRDWHATADH
ncbi:MULTISPECIES: GNAT family protein [Streptomyces]|uniref:GNAT family N-acetyltransferase n=1 Tax=Streptomyces durocortorensis TaxID=2811104 RepID=A0ABS2I0I0_9ACTN|nr:GNAT family protein [Streptomyces durocortorensis]MBM7056477.1 GNAT family N-acetyltransferase [Streptomyces durocortorensis]